MRKEGATADDVVAALVAQSATFAEKSAYAQAKYIKKKREKYLVACIYRGDGPEVLFAQRWASRVPLRAPRTYFAERSATSTNYIIITERLSYASEAEHPRGKFEFACSEARP